MLKELKNGCSSKHMYIHGHSSNIRYSQKVETTQISINGEWIHKWWYIHTTEYYSATKICEVLKVHPYVMWMNLEHMVGGRSQMQRSHIAWFHIYEISTLGDFKESERSLVVGRVWEEWGIRRIAQWAKALLLGWLTFFRMRPRWCCTTVWMH